MLKSLSILAILLLTGAVVSTANAGDSLPCGDLFDHKKSRFLQSDLKNHSTDPVKTGFDTVGEYYGVEHAHPFEVQDFTRDHYQDGNEVHGPCPEG